MKEEIFENTVLAILKTCPGIGSSQLRKALAIIDIIHNAVFGKGLTGCRYVKDRYGPVPDKEGSFRIIEMKYDRKIEQNEKEVGIFTQDSYFNIEDPDYNLFTNEQRNIINFAAGLFCERIGKKNPW